MNASRDTINVYKTIQELRASRKVETLMNEVRQYFPEATVSFIQTQVKVSKKIRWLLKDKMLALSLYNHSEKAYKLNAKMLKLPSKSTLQRTLQWSNIYSGFGEKVSKIDRNCVIF